MPSEAPSPVPESFDDLVQYCLEYEATIYVKRETPDGPRTVSLQSLPARERADEIKRWWRQGRFPHRVLR